MPRSIGRTGSSGSRAPCACRGKPSRCGGRGNAGARVATVTPIRAPAKPLRVTTLALAAAHRGLLGSEAHAGNGRRTEGGVKLRREIVGNGLLLLGVVATNNVSAKRPAKSESLPVTTLWNSGFNAKSLTTSRATAEMNAGDGSDSRRSEPTRMEHSPSNTQLERSQPKSLRGGILHRDGATSPSAEGLLGAGTA